MKSFVCIVLGVCLMLPPAGFAFETDQFNLPDAPLADAGAEVHEYVRENVQAAFDGLNREIEMRSDCTEQKRAQNCESPEKNRARLNRLRSPAALRRAVYDKLGAGFPPFTAAGSWMESHRFAAQPARYKTDFKASIYKTSPINYFTISRTVNLYGAEFGTDKIAHLFQQGYTYLRIYERARAKGASEAAALKRACDWGRLTERTYYGNLVSGVYSNADLAANYAGLKFYQNLTDEIRIGDEAKLPLVVLENGFWKFNETVALAENLLKPFVSDHFNEAFTPSIYTPAFGLRAAVRGRVKKRACAGWKTRFPNRTRLDYETISRNLRTWHGEDYGFTFNNHFVTIADACFSDAEAVPGAE